MRIAILGTGMVGTELGSKLAAVNHDVMLGSRTHDNAKATAWVTANGPRAAQGTFADAAAFGEVVFNCTNGAGSLEALQLAGSSQLADKILIDVANPLDFSKGFPPTLLVCNDDSLGEQIQRAFPDARVVKTLNTVNHRVMANPDLVPGDHNLFVCGNDTEAKRQVSVWLTDWFGWRWTSILDLGDITAARATEMYLPLWLRIMGAVGSPTFNLQLHASISVQSEAGQ